MPVGPMAMIWTMTSPSLLCLHLWALFIVVDEPTTNRGHCWFRAGPDSVLTKGIRHAALP